MSVNLSLKKDAIGRYKKGYSLIEKDVILNLDELKDEGEIINLVDSSGRFIAKGYYGRQNRGYGWVLTQNRDEPINKAFFTKKIKEAIEYRREFFKSVDTTAFRLFNGEGDGIGGLSIDYFDGYYLITWYSVGIYKFKDYILGALKSLVDFRGIYQKCRFDTKGQYVDSSSDYIEGERALEPLIVKENGVKFAIYLDDGAMVGVFLDQRDVRKAIRDRYAKGRTVLNTFSYTGAFSLFSAVGGAKITTSVDLAKRSLPKTTEMFEINNIDASTQNIVVQDVFEYFKYAVRKGLKFDMVIADPPSFARSKKYTFSVAKDYTNLLKQIIAITEINGIIVASTNYSSLSRSRFKDFIQNAFSETNCRYKIVEEFALPKDFKVDRDVKQSSYLKVFFIKKLS